MNTLGPVIFDHYREVFTLRRLNVLAHLGRQKLVHYLDTISFFGESYQRFHYNTILDSRQIRIIKIYDGPV